MSSRLFSTVFAVGSLAVLFSACDGPGAGGGEEGLEREELGTFTTDTGGGVDVPFETPDGAVSALVYCGPYGYDRLATAETVTDPSGATIYDMNDEAGTPMRVGVHADLLPMLIPVSPLLDIQPGSYGLRVYVDSEEATSVTCGAVYRTQAVKSASTVDLHLVFVGVDGIAPGLNGAEGESTLATVLDTLGSMWGEAGLSIGTVTYDDFEGDVDTYTVVDGDEELGNLLRNVTSNDARSVTYFFVQDITDDDGATILGLAGGPPGAAAVGGTSKSGVVVSVADFASDPDEVARIMAHEGGHFLGLFHTTEKDGHSSDPLDDTPECSTDSDGNGIFATSECAGTGAENLMWWASSDESTGMTEDQAWVIARSAAVY